MNIRRAKEKDIERVMELLGQVLQIHADIRPDIFIPGTTKYTKDELAEMIKDDTKPIYVAVDEKDEVLGYAFCIFQQYQNHNIMTDIKTIYIDDLCVDENCRGQHIGQQLYRYVLDYAKASGCYNVTLNVWACNENARKFYEKCGLVPQKIGMEVIL